MLAILFQPLHKSIQFLAIAARRRRLSCIWTWERNSIGKTLDFYHRFPWLLRVPFVASGWAQRALTSPIRRNLYHAVLCWLLSTRFCKYNAQPVSFSSPLPAKPSSCSFSILFSLISFAWDSFCRTIVSFRLFNFADNCFGMLKHNCSWLQWREAALTRASFRHQSSRIDTWGALFLDKMSRVEFAFLESSSFSCHFSAFLKQTYCVHRLLITISYLNWASLSLTACSSLMIFCFKLFASRRFSGPWLNRKPFSGPGWNRSLMLYESINYRTWVWLSSSSKCLSFFIASSSIRFSRVFKLAFSWTSIAKF